MIIIDNIKPKAPILQWQPPPLFRTEYEKQKYRENEKKKWIEGVGEIPGSLYFKTQELQIHHRVKGNTLRPVCRYSDLIKHQKMDECRKKGSILNIIKGRGEGLSADGGCLANYFMRVFPGTKSLITSSEQAKIATLFSEKIMVPFRSMDDDIRPVISNKNETKSSCGLIVEVNHKDEFGKAKMSLSKVFTKETSDSNDSATGFSGEGAIFGFYDEFFLHRRRQMLLESSVECYRDPDTGEVTGFLLTGGTIEPRLNNAQLTDLQKLVEEIQTNGMLSTAKADLLFIPFYMTKYLDEAGYPNEKKAMDWWDSQMDQIRKSKDTVAASAAERAFRMNNPRSLEDIFELASSARWEDDVAEKIKLQHKLVVSQSVPITTCKLVDMNSKIEVITNNKGPVHILENPKPNVDYWLLIDGVATGKKTGDEEGSDVAGTIVKGYDPSGDSYSPVCVYTERPGSVEDSYIVLASQAKYYNLYGGLKGINAEANASTADHFSTFLEKIGLGKYMVMRKDLSGKGHSNTKKFFQHVTVDVRDWQMRQANIFLRKYIGNIKMLLLLNDMMKAAGENADILDSWLMFFPTVGADFDKAVERKKPLPPRQLPVFVKDANGVIRREWKNV